MFLFLSIHNPNYITYFCAVKHKPFSPTASRISRFFMVKLSIVVHYELGNFKLVTASTERTSFHSLVPWYFVRLGVVDDRYLARDFRKYEVSSLVFDALCSVGSTCF